MTRAIAGLAVLILTAAYSLPFGVSLAQELDPQQLVLSIDDLPPGFAVKPESDTYLSNADSANGNEQTLSELDAHGRQAGYTVTFEQEGGDLSDFLSITSNTSVYETVEGARGLFDLRAGTSLEDWTALPVPLLGDQTVGANREIDVGGETLMITTVLIRKGRVLASVVTVSLEDASIDETLQIARTVAEKLP